MNPGDKVNILPTSWIHKAGWVAAGVKATGEVTKVAKNGKISVRVNEVRNSLKRDCDTTTGVKKVCTFAATDLEAAASCQWFARCTNVAVTTVKHSVLGEVPCCQRCADFANS